MGKKTGYRNVTLYVEPGLYEKVRFSAYTLQEDIYLFVGEALANAVERRLTRTQRDAVEAMAKQNKNGVGHKHR